jgi:hypothetical protein
MFARRRQVQPDVIPSVDGARTDRATARAPASASLQGARLAPHPKPDGAQRPRTATFVEATARRRQETMCDEVDTDLLQITRMVDGARRFQTENRERASMSR